MSYSDKFPSAKEFLKAIEALGNAARNAKPIFIRLGAGLKKSKQSKQAEQSKSYLKLKHYQDIHKDRTPHYQQNVGKSKRW